METMGPARSRIARSTIVDRRRNDSRSLLCRPGRDLGSPRGCKENLHHGNGATFRLMFRKKRGPRGRGEHYREPGLVGERRGDPPRRQGRRVRRGGLVAVLADGGGWSRGPRGFLGGVPRGPSLFGAPIGRGQQFLDRGAEALGPGGLPTQRPRGVCGTQVPTRDAALLGDPSGGRAEDNPRDVGRCHEGQGVRLGLGRGDGQAVR